MEDIFSAFLIVLATGTVCSGVLEDPIDEELINLKPLSPNGVKPDAMAEDLAHAMDLFQRTAEIAEKKARDGVLPQEEIDKLYRLMSEMLDDVADLILYNSNNAYSFLNGQGFDKIVTRNLDITFTPLRSRLLTLTKIFFNKAPTTAKTVIPWKILDKLMDIFEQDDNLAMKSLAMEILSVWLPDNPRAQERVMKLKGLQPFYKQITKLDSSVIRMILKLFNSIITEHTAARNKKMQKSKADYVTLKLYQKIGLIERLSTPAVCNGLLNIFAEVWTFTTEEKDALPPVLELIQNIKPHCLNVYKGRSRAAVLLNQILNFLRDPTKQEYIDRLEMNVTQISESFTDFLEKIKIIPRYEL